jgi:hypothetical protein
MANERLPRPKIGRIRNDAFRTVTKPERTRACRDQTNPSRAPIRTNPSLTVTAHGPDVRSRPLRPVHTNESCQSKPTPASSHEPTPSASHERTQVAAKTERTRDPQDCAPFRPPRRRADPGVLLLVRRLLARGRGYRTAAAFTCSSTSSLTCADNTRPLQRGTRPPPTRLPSHATNSPRTGT